MWLFGCFVFTGLELIAVCVGTASTMLTVFTRLFQGHFLAVSGVDGFGALWPQNRKDCVYCWCLFVTSYRDGLSGIIYKVRGLL